MKAISFSRRVNSLLVGSILLIMSSASNAALVGRDLDGDSSTSEAYYDDVLDITWLADANYAQTSGYDADGKMNWNDATDWAASLTLGGQTGWRLANAIDTGDAGCDLGNSGTDCGYNVGSDAGELAHLFHVTLGNNSWFDESGDVRPSGQGGLQNTGQFSNVQNNIYWTSEEYIFSLSNTTNPPSFLEAWTFNLFLGHQDRDLKADFEYYAWAVLDGDISNPGIGNPTPAPLPAAAWLFGAALFGLAVTKRKSARKR